MESHRGLILVDPGWGESCLIWRHLGSGRQFFHVFPRKWMDMVPWQLATVGWCCGCDSCGNFFAKYLENRPCFLDDANDSHRVTLGKSWWMLALWINFLATYREMSEKCHWTTTFHSDTETSPLASHMDQHPADAKIYEKFGRIFARLPLASVVDNQAGCEQIESYHTFPILGMFGGVFSCIAKKDAKSDAFFFCEAMVFESKTQVFGTTNWSTNGRIRCFGSFGAPGGFIWGGGFQMKPFTESQILLVEHNSLGAFCWMGCSPILLLNFQTSHQISNPRDIIPFESHKLANRLASSTHRYVNDCIWLVDSYWFLLMVYVVKWVESSLYHNPYITLTPLYHHYLIIKPIYHPTYITIKPLYHPYLTHWFLPFSWDLRGSRRPLPWRTGEFPATAGSQGELRATGWSKFRKSLRVSDDPWDFWWSMRCRYLLMISPLQVLGK